MKFKNPNSDEVLAHLYANQEYGDGVSIFRMVRHFTEDFNLLPLDEYNAAQRHIQRHIRTLIIRGEVYRKPKTIRYKLTPKGAEKVVPS